MASSPTPRDVIFQYAPRLGLDPNAVYAYMMEESSGNWHAVGDHGTSFGPFQMHQGGALGSHSAAWAESPAGLIGGMRMMAQTAIKGQTGTDALWSIYQNFGRGSDDAAAYQRALPYMTSSVNAGGKAGSLRGSGARFTGYYVNPVPSGAAFERTDQGIDWRGKPGQEVVAMGDSQVIRISTNAGGFGTAIYLKLTDGPWAGRVYYVGHALPTVKVGQRVTAGDPVAMLLDRPLGNAGGDPGHTEIGWANSNGSGPAAALGPNTGGVQFQKDLSSMGILAPGARANDLFSSGTTQVALTPEQRSAISARNASAQAPGDLGVSVPDATQPVDDTPTLWASIAGQDNVSAETTQMAAQYVQNQFAPQPGYTSGPLASYEPAAAGLPV